MSNHERSEACILIVTRRQDSTADYVLRRMDERGVLSCRLNAEDFGETKISLKFPSFQDSTLSIGDVTLETSKIRGVWLRRLSKPQATQVQGVEAKDFAESEMDFTLRWFIQLLGRYCPILDPEARVMEGQNKFDQLNEVSRFGLTIPATLVTNDPVAAKDFVERHKAVAIKSIAGYGYQVEGGFYTTYTNMVTEEVVEQFESIRLAPVCLQEYIEKEFELRVTVVGERVFACRIDSQKTSKTTVDWRRQDSATPYSVFDISKELTDQLMATMRHYGIRLASFDLIVTPDGQTVFLEMNPATQFLWIEELTDMPITDAVIDEILAQCQRL